MVRRAWRHGASRKPSAHPCTLYNWCLQYPFLLACACLALFITTHPLYSLRPACTACICPHFRCGVPTPSISGGVLCTNQNACTCVLRWNSSVAYKQAGQAARSLGSLKSQDEKSGKKRTRATSASAAGGMVGRVFLLLVCLLSEPDQRAGAGR